MIERKAMAWLAAAGMLAACGEPATPPAAKADAVSDATAVRGATGVLPTPEPVAKTADATAFVGTWTGPEGLSFVVEPGVGGRYRVRNRDTLDTEQTFDATVTGDALMFVRRGEKMTARPGTGAETGFKWLANKKKCLIVQDGVEGYCRD